MRIEFKSVLILDESSVKIGHRTMTTTIYDLRSVQDHVLEKPMEELLFHPGVWGRVALLVAPAGFLLWLFADQDPLKHPFTFFGVLVPWFALCFSLTYHAEKIEILKEFARHERGLSESTKITTVESSRWGSFVSSLKQPTATDLRMAEFHKQLDGMKDFSLPAAHSNLLARAPDNEPLSPEVEEILRRIRESHANEAPKDPGDRPGG